MSAKNPEPTQPIQRTRMATFYITEHDYRKLKRYAADGGFKGVSHMITAIVEPLLQGDFSIMSFVRSAKRLQKFMESNGAQFVVDSSSLRELPFFAPPPPPIPEEPISVDQLRKDFERVLAVLEREQRATNKPTPTPHADTHRNPSPSRRERVRG
jgi:hypothetical protein